MATKARRQLADEDMRGVFDEVVKRLPDMTQEELAELFTDLQPLRPAEISEAEHEEQKTQAQQRIPAPRNDDELHALIIELTGFNIPRVAVCHDHCAPFDPIADAYFNREQAILVMASREGGKTIGISVLQYVNSETKPGIEGVTFGAIKRQAEQAYKYVKSFVFTRDEAGNRIPKPQIAGDPTRERIEWKTGSMISIIVGTKSGVNSPHPQTVHADEVDLMDPEVFAESRNMSSSRSLPGGGRIPAIDIVTSTRKSARGPMQDLINEVENAKKQGVKPPWKLYSFCFKEVAQEQPNCFPAGTLVDSDCVTGSFKRWYEGPLCTLEDAEGHTLSATPHHPVLTTGGWKPMGELRPGDELVCGVRREDVLPADPDVEDVPTSIEEVDGFLEMLGASRVVGVGMDFHGDVAEGDVDVVLADGLLELNGRAAPLLQPPSEHLLADADAGLSEFSASSSGQQLLLRSRSTTDGVVSLGEKLEALFVAEVRHTRAHGRRPRSGDACIEEMLANGVTPDAQTLGYLYLGNAFVVETTKVVRVDVKPFRGHVYNLQTDTDAYISNGIVVHNCRCVDPVLRVRRLLELGLDPHSMCECDKIVKGQWDEQHPRTLESVCRGDLFRSRGWMHKDDIDRKFTQNIQAVWEAQMECRRPIADGLYLNTFSRTHHCVRGWAPRPQYGRISMGVDWGGADTSVVLWTQGPLLMPVEIMGFAGRPIVVPQGAYVVFDSKYWFERVGATRMADEVVAREIAYREKYPGWRVHGRFADMAGAQQRNDWNEHNPPLRTQWYITRDFDPSVETVQGLMTENLLYVDIEGLKPGYGASDLADDFEGWRQKGGKEVHDDASHGPAALRYNLGNVVVMERRREKSQGQREAMPAVRERGVDSVDRGGLVGAVGSSNGQPAETENWRQSIGMMTSNPGSEGWRI